MSEFKHVPLKEIKPDPNQPRKFFDEASLGELIDSVREKGVIQPILVRPHGKGYRIVCGERRFHAANAVSAEHKDRNTIPAIIRELTDAEALDLQIIENLQRKDVNPMEEAVAFKMLLDSGRTAEEIGLKVGKSPFFVRQRITLTKLTDQWQKAVFFGNISLKDAMRVSELKKESQEKLFEDEVMAESVGRTNYQIMLSVWDVNRYRGSLTDGVFDLADPTLNPERGSCLTCPFNTNYAVLFPDSNQARCTDIDCFNLKCDRSFEARLNEFMEDPSALFVITAYSPDSKAVSKLEKKGITPLVYNSYETLRKPDLPERELWMDRNADDFDSDAEAEKAWQDELSEYSEELAEYEKDIQSGRYRKALVVIGDNKGQFIYVKLKKGAAAAAKASGSKSDTGTDTEITAADIDEEISGIQNREKRAKELDDQKIFGDVYPHITSLNNVRMFKGGELTATERVAAAKTIFNTLGFSHTDDFLKHFKIKDIDKITEVSFSQINEMLRFFFTTKLAPAPTTLYRGHTGDSSLCMKLGREYFPSVMKEIEDNHAERINKRIARLDARVAELKKKKKELQPAKAKAAKKK